MIAWWLCAGIALAGGDAAGARVDAPPWKGSQAGRTDEVLAPWTPIRLTQSGPSIEVRPWGRVYAFSARPFPERIVSRDEDLLAAPIEIAVRGGPEAPTRATLEVSNRSDARVALESNGEAGPLAFRARTQIEYDGLIRVDLAFEQKELDPVQEIALAIPLRSEFARYLYRYPGRWGSAENAGALPEEGWSSPFRPFIWLGGEDRGLAWFCESDRNWSPADPKRAIRVTREGAETVLRLLLHAGKERLEAPLEYTFGLQATPVKPVPEDAWDWRISHAGRYGLEVPDASGTSELDRIAGLGVRTICFHEHWSDIQNYPKAADPDRLRKLVAACHEKKIRLLLYFGYEMSTIAPEWDAYSAECLVDPRAGGYTRKPDQKAFIVCYRSCWQDFIADGIARVMDEYGIDGV
ncbi:MAG: hypothetical protein JXP34_23780, partial [Planctomycetes bacterium]|nr:hypothetical protein [Planctomycetota bacterium]